MMAMDGHAEASVDLGAITGNIAALRRHAAPAALMAVVKANGYGHGAVPAARAAVRGGADWLGVVHVAEALELRRAGIDVPLLVLVGLAAWALARLSLRPLFEAQSRERAFIAGASIDRRQRAERGLPIGPDVDQPQRADRGRIAGV